MSNIIHAVATAGAFTIWYAELKKLEDAVTVKQNLHDIAAIGDIVILNSRGAQFISTVAGFSDGQVELKELKTVKFKEMRNESK